MTEYGSVSMNEIEKSEIAELNQIHEEIEGLKVNFVKMSFSKAVRAGEILTKIKADLKHGEFMDWIEKNLTFTDRTARRYMKVFECKDSPKMDTVSDLTEAYKLLTEKTMTDIEYKKIVHNERMDDAETQEEKKKLVSEYIGRPVERVISLHGDDVIIIGTESKPKEESAVEYEEKKEQAERITKLEKEVSAARDQTGEINLLRTKNEKLRDEVRKDKAQYQVETLGSQFDKIVRNATSLAGEVSSFLRTLKQSQGKDAAMSGIETHKANSKLNTLIREINRLQEQFDIRFLSTK